MVGCRVRSGFAGRNRCRNAPVDSIPTRSRPPQSRNRPLAQPRKLVPICARSSRACRNRCRIETADDGGIPGRVKIFFAGARLDRDAIAAAIFVIRSVQRLMDVADKMDQKRQITFGAPAVVVAVFQALGVSSISQSRSCCRDIARQRLSAGPGGKCR